MKKPRNPATETAEQRFTVPPAMPFLEIRSTFRSVLPYAGHFHSVFSFGLILEGRTRFSLDGETHVAERGDIVLIAPGHVHSCNPVGGVPRGYHMVFIDDAWFRDRVGTALGMRDGVRPCKPLLRDPDLFREAVKLVEAACSGDAGLEDAFAGLFVAMQRAHGCFVPAGPEGRVAPESGIVLPGGEDSDEPAACSVTGLARAAGVRRESFSRAVRRKTGLPPSRYLHCLRLEKGRLMLRQGAGIAEAAAASGYADQSHFHRMFVKFFSVTPGCYRKNRSHPYKK